MIVTNISYSVPIMGRVSCIISFNHHKNLIRKEIYSFLTDVEVILEKITQLGFKVTFALLQRTCPSFSIILPHMHYHLYPHIFAFCRRAFKHRHISTF